MFYEGVRGGGAEVMLRDIGVTVRQDMVDI